jgi:3-hydroxymyristoyl/3-hydroxydecanoyl-(acyl carrier protein) dehydratase
MCYITKFIDRKSDIYKDDCTVSAHVAVPADSVWFDGHFPGEALLPGVAQLAIVVEILGEVLEKPMCVTDVSRVRFKLAIKPGERIDVQITSKGNNTPAWGFRLFKGSELACNGFLSLAEL